MTVVVGGVGQLYQGDLDLGRRVVERLQTDELGTDVVVEDLYYGAVAVAQLLEELAPSLLIVVGAESRGRPAGVVERRRLWGPTAPDAQAAVAEAVQGYVSVDLLVDVAAALGVLPERVVAIEMEPAALEPSTELSGLGVEAFAEVLRLVRVEVGRVPLLGLADDIRARLTEACLERTRALETLEALLEELGELDAEGRWGRTFAECARLKAAIVAGETSEGMTHLDWGLWWALIEELERLQRHEVAV